MDAMLSQGQVALELGVSNARISQLERHGDKNISLIVSAILCKLYKVSLDDFVKDLL